MDRTLILVKPDAFARGLTGEVVGRFERRGLVIAALKRMTLEREHAERHYAEHAEKPFYGELVSFLTRSPVVAMVVEGPGDDTWQLGRTLIGKTQVADAQPGSIRGDFATTTNENLVHGSDGLASAEREIALWFPGA
jgi:nucleoside-diphosphate kinase